MFIIGVILTQFFSFSLAGGSLSLLIIFLIYSGLNELVNNYKKKKLLEEYDKTQIKRDLSRIDKITKNGIVINASDFIAEHKVKKCPYCTEEVNINAIKCRYCSEEIGKGYEIIADGTYVSNKISLKKQPDKNKITLADIVITYVPWILGGYLLISFLKWKYPYYFLELQLWNF